jgi:hypothetical protein
MPDDLAHPGLGRRDRCASGVVARDLTPHFLDFLEAARDRRS